MFPCGILFAKSIIFLLHRLQQILQLVLKLPETQTRWIAQAVVQRKSLKGAESEFISTWLLIASLYT